MEQPIYQVDAFTTQLFGGNPAAVCPLDQWLDDETLQAIAAENNLSETAFFVTAADGFELRWFTPAVEVDLCGHATLATAYVLFNELDYDLPEIRFHTKSGELVVQRKGDILSMNFPANELHPQKISPPLARSLDVMPIEQFSGGVFTVLVLESAEEVAAVTPDFAELLEIGFGKVIITAKGDDCDFVSRVFGPGVGINEDPVTGSAHCVLVPYWAEKLGKTELRARQISARGGVLDCTLSGDRVILAGGAKLYMRGTLFLDTI